MVGQRPAPRLTGTTGYELHNCVDAGEPFERLIDHPSWIEHVRHYCGEERSYVEGLFIDEKVHRVDPPIRRAPFG